MIYTDHLEDLIHNTSPAGAEEIVIISGYVGIEPVRNIAALNLRTKVVCGMVSTDRIQRYLHQALVQVDTQISNLEILYTQSLPVHSKCYVWRDRSENILHAYIGSANFSNSGLNTPRKEILTTVERGDFTDLNRYINLILIDCVRCNVAPQPLMRQPVTTPPVTTTPVQAAIGTTIRLSLLKNNRQIHTGGGLNWGHGGSGRSHTNPGDAYIKIPMHVLRFYPGFFTPIPPGRRRGRNVLLDLTWDDGMSMRGLAEGAQPYGRQTFPKQLASAPRKDIMGKYFRRRLGVGQTARISLADLQIRWRLQRR